MPFASLPQGWFPGLTDGATVCLATDMVVPIATFPEMTAAEIDSTTGDIRKMLYAICEKCWLVWNSLAALDKPGKMTLGKSSSTNAATGLTTHTYSFTFVNSVSAQDVAPEV